MSSVTSMFSPQEEPYIMYRKPDIGETLHGNERFEGYCKDLADLISKKLGIHCKCVLIGFTLHVSLCLNVV